MKKLIFPKNVPVDLFLALIVFVSCILISVFRRNPEVAELLSLFN